MGLWLTNQVLLQPLSAEQPTCQLALPCQPRSLAVISSGSSGDRGTPAGSSSGGTFLVVGSSSGEVLWWQLAVQQDAFGGSTGVQLEESGWARAGLAPVTLHLLPPAPATHGSNGSSMQAPAPERPTAPADTSDAAAAASSGPASRPTLLAVSDQALLLGPDAAQPSHLAPARLHGAQGLAAACPLITAELPGSSLAYVQGGELHIGGVDPAVQLRWDELPLGDSAVASAALALGSCGVAAVACAEAHGGSSLRLLDASSLDQLAWLPMPAGHAITALAAVHLPCSSLFEAATGGPGSGAGSAGGSAAAVASGAPAAAEAGTKEFLLVALSADAVAAGGSGQAAEEELPDAYGAGAAGAESSQHWWRQQPTNERQPASGQQGQQAGSSPQPQPAAMLRVYEVRQRQQPEPAPGSTGTSSSRGHELVLHGSCPLPTAVFSLTAVQPDTQAYSAWIAGTPPGSSGSADTGSAAEQHSAPMLAAGCHDGMVRLYR